ncbi:DUF4861 family protein [Paraflavisolibacter sp. H34]|uniref:DUF4861 family protein n=1 Tax=Huijunlia imazamoxiresistens TaxID=3127457 RepID=UPI0030171A27
MKKTALLLACILALVSGRTQTNNWYTQGDFTPAQRIQYTLINDLDMERTHCPVVIPRKGFPLPDIHEMWITVVDPQLPPAGKPGDSLLKLQGGHQLREETNGHALFHQLDDLDKDGIWDELYFITDLKPKEKKTIYLYFGENIRGWNRHFTHANIGSYVRHQMPFWESEEVGWKIWFANSVDVFAKRKPVLIAHRLYMENIDGYGIGQLNEDYGSDIQSVAGSFGGGAICLFEHPALPDSISRPRFTPAHARLAPKSFWNAGQISDTRYAYEVVVNGPLRSIIKIKTMNWKSGSGTYELEQYYTAYAHQSYTTCQVKYTRFAPAGKGVLMGAGIRKKPGAEDLFQQGGIVISSGPEGIKDPEHIDDRMSLIVPFIGKAIVIKDQYKPRYQYVPSFEGNHALKVTAAPGNAYEYMLFAAWSEGPVLNTAEKFKAYVLKTAKEYNAPVRHDAGRIEDRKER